MINKIMISIRNKLKGFRPLDLLFSLILPALFLLLWTWYAKKVNNNAIIPPIGVVVNNFAHAWDNFIGLGSIFRNIGYSLVRVALGYFCGAFLALPLGLAMGYFKPVRTFFENFFSIFKPIPAISWQPLVLGWFGVNSLARIFNVPYGPTFAVLDNFKLAMIALIVLGSFYPIWGNTMFGVSTVPKNLIESSKVLGASEKDIFFRILLPACAPNIVNGLRMGLTSSWVCLVCAEMLPGSMCGVGYLITHAYELARMDLVITGMICIGLIGAFLDGIFRVFVVKRVNWVDKVK
ncbi:MAG: ABC transporter permease [Dehalococcoidales bacterium]|nr:ABC transporter permease [Dehalococcoidales bacterium]